MGNLLYASVCGVAERGAGRTELGRLCASLSPQNQSMEIEVNFMQGLRAASVASKQTALRIPRFQVSLDRSVGVTGIEIDEVQPSSATVTSV